MYRMVVTDLDGTLLNNKKQVSEANVKAIQNLKDQNITFVMATGRSDVMTRAYTKQLKNVDIVIGCDGAVIRNIRTGEILCENHLRSETCHTTFEICKKYGLQYYVFAKDELVSDDPQNERFLVHQKFNQTVEEDEEIPMQIVDDLNEYVMAISLGEGIGLSATEVISENDQVAVIPLKESHHHADYAVGYHQDNGKKAIQQFMKYVEDYFRL